MDIAEEVFRVRGQRSDELTYNGRGIDFDAMVWHWCSLLDCFYFFVCVVHICGFSL